MSSSDKQLECFVCGQATRNRCSSCAKAGLDIAFCSTEHQKLVWFAHKLVCGPGKARPFRHPKLNDAELDILQDDVFREQLSTVEEHVIQGDVLRVPRDGLLEWCVGAPKGSLLQNLHHLNSWISSLSPAPWLQSEFYRTLRSLIGKFVRDTGSTSAAYAASAFWEATKLEGATGYAVPYIGLIGGLAGLEDRLAPVLHLAVIRSAVVQLQLAAPETDAPIIPQDQIITQLERLLQSFADISPAPTLDLLTALLSTIAATVLTLPPLEHYRIDYTPLSQDPPSVRVTITRCA